MVPVVVSTVLSMTERVPDDDAVGIVLGEHADGELVAGVEAAHGGEVLFRHVEVDEDGRDLMDHHQRNVVGLHQIAGVDQQVAGASGEGRADLAVTEIELGGGRRRSDRYRARPWRSRCRPGWRARIRGRRRRWCCAWSDWDARDDAGFGEFGVAIGIALVEFGLGGIAGQGGFRLGDLGAVAGHVGFGLAESFLVGARIDLEEKIALGDVLAFGEADAQKLAGDLRFDLHDGGRFHGADHAQFGGHGFLGGLGHRHWDDGRSGRSLGGLRWFAGVEEQQAQTGQHDRGDTFYRRHDGLLPETITAKTTFAYSSHFSRDGDTRRRALLEH